MSVSITYALDPLQLAELIADSWLTLTLWVANTPDGTYTNASVTPSPTTLALMSSGEDYIATFDYSAGNPSQWFRVRAYDGVAYSALSDAAPFHGGGGTNRNHLRQQLGREIRDMRVATLTSGSGPATAVFSSVDVTRFADSYFNNWFLNNTTRDSWSQGVAWTKSSASLTLSPSITSQASGDSVELTRRFTPTEYNEAINYAIAACYPILNKTIVTTATQTALNTYQFDVPQDIKSVSSIEIESPNFSSSTSDATRGHPYRDVPFRIIRNGLRQKIELESPMAADRRLRIIGTGPLSQLNGDTEYVEEIDPQLDILIFAAAHHLYSGLPNDAASSDIDRYKQLADYYWSKYMEKRGQYGQSRPAKRMWSPETRSSGYGAGRLSASYDMSNFP